MQNCAYQKSNVVNTPVCFETCVMCFRLEDTKAELDEERRQSSSSKMISETEARDLRNKYVLLHTTVSNFLYEKCYILQI